jgi:hydrogenase/urease accessory protein HupE
MLENLFAFIEFGLRHIIPDGPDHMLFVVALFLNARGWASLLIQVTTFTIAHTITLGLAATGLVEVPANIVEPMIALSIAVLALEAIFFRKANIWRLPVIFAFGLFHGLGFGSLMKAYLESADLWAGLAGITIGVEAGHLTVLATAAAVAFVVRSALKSIGQGEIYRRAFLVPVAIIIALVGAYWTVQRIGLLPV